MSSTPKFAHCDTKKPDGFYVQFERVIETDDNTTPPDERVDGFWPSRDQEDAGYCPPKYFDKSQREAERIMAAWRRGDYYYIGVRARALCLIVKNGVGTYINLDSGGLWGVENEADEGYLNEIYQEEISSLKHMIETMRNPTYE